MPLAPEDMLAIVGSGLVLSFLHSAWMRRRAAAVEAWLIWQTQRLLLRPDERDPKP